MIERRTLRSEERDELRNPQATPARTHSSQRDRVRRRHARTRVLVVNGYADGRDMYADYLRFNGFMVDAASDPVEALHRIQAVAPDVIVTDFAFPGSGPAGPAFIARVRDMAFGQAPCIIVISGFTQSTDRRQAREAGADRFLLKPCLPKALLRIIDRITLAR